MSFLSINLSFAQTEKDSYEIYSSTINRLVENWFDPPIEAIIVVERYSEKFKQDFSDIMDLTIEKIPKSTLSWYVRDSLLQQRFLNDQNIKKVLRDLFANFNNHPKIKSELLNVNGVEIHTLNSKKYHSYLNRGQKWRKNGWKRLENKYNSKFAIQFSKISYQGNYASFYYEYLCGDLCAAGAIALMENAEGEWKVLKEFNLWES
ncbi:hypothetical protein [uncultured Croceitalea sp.]|uniref:hypothetical protein n=1 Tax=uncultured Croceitalea sp. TaxID=1798908 RepID=UPI003305B05F